MPRFTLFQWKEAARPILTTDVMDVEQQLEALFELRQEFDIATEIQVALQRLNRDLRQAAKTMARKDCRAVVSLYYQIQEDRKRCNNQLKAAKKAGRSCELIEYIMSNLEVIEADIRASLLIFANEFEVGKWALAQHGIGPVITAGLLAYLDPEPPQYVGHWWSFAGVIGPNQRMPKKGEPWPYNTSLKTLLYKIGDSMMKQSGNEKCFYGAMYRERKALEIDRNGSGALGSEAQRALSGKNWSKTTQAWPWYNGCYTADTYAGYLAYSLELRSQKVSSAQIQAKLGEFLKERRLPEGEGQQMLPPAHIEARAKRYTFKFFLSHWHWVDYELHYKKPVPDPWIVAHDPKHTRVVPPPHYDPLPRP